MKFALVAAAALPADAAGFRWINVPDPADKPLSVALWYPSDAPPALLPPDRPIRQVVAENGPLVGTGLPLVVISHGTGGWAGGHRDTALALAEAGFVVAAVTHTAVTHTGDNARDLSYVGQPRQLVERPRHIHVVLDYLLDRWPGRAQLDAARVGIFGFSAGGFTALVAVGGVPDLRRIATHCAEHPEAWDCRYVAAHQRRMSAAAEAPPTWVHDMRIRAAVVAAPAEGFDFDPDGLAQVTLPMQLWRASDDQIMPDAWNSGVVRRLLPMPPEDHLVPNAGHYAFCPEAATSLPDCRDAPGFDRLAFHEAFNRAVVGFFAAQLAAAP
jgi:predicted dienelactone hydrolase